MHLCHLTRHVFVALVASCLAVAQAEEVEAPLYTNWSKFPVGTTVTQKATMTQLGKTITTTTVVKLIEKNDKHVLLTKVVSSDGTGQVITNDPIPTTIRRMFPVFPGVDKTKIGRPQGSQNSGMECVEVLGRKYQAEWYETKSNTEAGPSLTRTWISMDVPDMLLKSRTEVKVADKVVNIEITSIQLGAGK